MAYGIGSVIGDIDQKVDTYRNKPEALAQMYQQNQQLIDLLALQKLKTEKEVAMRDMQLKMQTPAATIKDQREQEVMGMMRNEVAQQVAPGVQIAGQQAAAQNEAPQGGGLSSLPAPNMQGIGMAEGGIVAFAGERGSYVSQEAYRRQKAKEEAERRRRADEAPADSALGDMWDRSQTKELLTDPKAQWDRSKTKDVAEYLSRVPGAVSEVASQATSGLGSLLKRAGSAIAESEGRTIPLSDTGAEGYVQLMENPALALTPEQKQLETAKNMGLIPDERPPAPQPAPQAAPQPAGIRAALPQAQTQPPAVTALSEEGINAVLNVPSEAVKQAPPEVQSEYTRRLGELRAEQESKLETLIAFLQGAGGKTSFAAAMAGGAAGMDAREQRIEGEIMATVDKIEGLKLKERELGVEESKVAATREGNIMQAEASRYNTDKDFEAAMATVDANNYNTLMDYQAAMAEKAASGAKAINDAIEKQQLTTAQRLELHTYFDENLAADVRDAIIEQLKEKGESTPDSPEGQKIIQDGLAAARNEYVMTRIGDVAQSYGEFPGYNVIGKKQSQ